jgi:hypothetical protein
MRISVVKSKLGSDIRRLVCISVGGEEHPSDALLPFRPVASVQVRLMETPPSTRSALPVVKLDASEAR